MRAFNCTLRPSVTAPVVSVAMHSDGVTERGGMAGNRNSVPRAPVKEEEEKGTGPGVRVPHHTSVLTTSSAPHHFLISTARVMPLLVYL